MPSVPVIDVDLALEAGLGDRAAAARAQRAERVGLVDQHARRRSGAPGRRSRASGATSPSMPNMPSVAISVARPSHWRSAHARCSASAWR